MRKMIRRMKKCMERNKLTVNVNESKIMRFRREGGRSKESNIMLYGAEIWVGKRGKRWWKRYKKNT